MRTQKIEAREENIEVNSMKFYEFNEDYELRRVSFDFESIINSINEFGGFATNEYREWIYGCDWLKEKREKFI